MRFAIDKPVKIVILGAGGTGGYAIPHLYRLLHSLERPVKIIVADGDTVESRNLIRQNFVHTDVGRNKAQTLAERYSTAFGMETLFVPEYVESEERLTELVKPDRFRAGAYSNQSIEELVILVGCVDNNRSRQLCHSVFKKADNLVYIDSGNGEYTGQVVCGVKRKGRTYYNPIGDVYPDVLSDTDKFPTQLSCAEAAVSAPQSIVANIMAATVVVSYIYNILVLGNIAVRSVTFSTKTVNLKPVISQKSRRKSA